MLQAKGHLQNSPVFQISSNLGVNVFPGKLNLVFKKQRLRNPDSAILLLEALQLFASFGLSRRCKSLLQTSQPFGGVALKDCVQRCDFYAVPSWNLMIENCCAAMAGSTVSLRQRLALIVLVWLACNFGSCVPHVHLRKLGAYYIAPALLQDPDPTNQN